MWDNKSPLDSLLFQQHLCQKLSKSVDACWCCIVVHQCRFTETWCSYNLLRICENYENVFGQKFFWHNTVFTWWDLIVFYLFYLVRLGLGWRQVYCVYYSSWRALVQSSGQHGLTWHWHSSISGLEVMTGRPSLHTRRCSGINRYYSYYTPLTALFQGLPRILPKQETVSGSGIIWAIGKSPPCSRQITTPAPHHPVFFTGWMPFLPPNQQCQSTEETNH